MEGGDDECFVAATQGNAGLFSIVRWSGFERTSSSFRSFATRFLDPMPKLAASFVLFILLLAFFVEIRCSASSESAVSQQFSSTSPCYNTSSGEISTTGRFNHIVSIADVHGDSDSLLRSLWISRNHIAASTPGGDQLSFQDFEQVIEKEIGHPSGADQHSPFSGCSTVLLVQVRPLAAASHSMQSKACQIICIGLINNEHVVSSSECRLATLQTVARMF